MSRNKAVIVYNRQTIRLFCGCVNFLSNDLRGSQSVALDLRGRDSHQRLWSCIFSQLVSVESMEIYSLPKYPYRLPLLFIKCKITMLIVVYNMLKYAMLTRHSEIVYNHISFVP